MLSQQLLDSWSGWLISTKCIEHQPIQGMDKLRVRVDSSSSCDPRFPLLTVKNMATQIHTSFYVAFVWSRPRFDFRGWTAKGGRCAHSPLLTEIQQGLVLRGVARAHIHSYLRKLLSAVCYSTSAFTARTTILSTIFTAPM